MDKHIELSITSPTTEVKVTSVDADEVARIVKLAGIQSPSPAAPVSTAAPMTAPAPVSTPAPMTEPALDPISMPELDQDSMQADENLPQMSSEDEFDMSTDLDDDMFDSESDLDHSVAPDSPTTSQFHEAQAEFDHGHEPDDSDLEKDGEEIPINDYIWNAEKLPQRIKGTQGDNGLLEKVYSNLLQKYKEFLNEERENDAGILSPLSDPTKPEFDKDPLSDETPVDDGSHSPMSTIKRQSFYK